MSLTDKRRPIELGEFMVRNSATVRAAAKHFNISKSTVHKDIRTKLPELDRELYEKVEKVLEINKSQRHIRGGMATKRKYELKHKESQKICKST